MSTAPENLRNSTSEAPPLTLLEIVDDILAQAKHKAQVQDAQRKLVESRRAPQTMKRSEFKAVQR